MGCLWYNSSVNSNELTLFYNLLQRKQTIRNKKKGKEKVKKKISLLFVLSVLVLSLLLGGCSSAQGVGSAKVLGASPVWFVITLVVFVVIGILVAYFVEPEDEKGRQGKTWVFIGLLVAFLILQMVIGGFVTVDQTEIGVKTRFGKAIGITMPGGHFLVPYIDRVVIFSAKDWTYSTMDEDFMAVSTDDYEDHPASLVTADNVQASVTYSVIGRIDPVRVMDIYQRYGSLDEAVEKAVKAPSRIIVRQKLKDFTAKQIYLEVDNVDAAVVAELRPFMEDAGLQLVFFGFRKPTLGINGDYETELNNEMVAAQRALVAQQNIAVSEAQAQQAIATADGEKEVAIRQAEARAAATRAEQEAIADATLYATQKEAEGVKMLADAEAYRIIKEAEANAKANTLLAAVLTPDLIQYIKLIRWNGVLPMYTGMDAGILISPE